ncbi:oxidoreductase [Myriangium duriaei CBS 260.36]|uniref:Oxidoreductase n=1 Tax=Myriangium duriaei CBS 260.36 TaxID=1168546 RepID=A0A9P4IZG9_9PEZI|nr:oxidoreductase [Myriangium duriaei CBS 260.36]
MGSWFSSSKSFVPETDIPDLSGKVVLITGGNTGLGKETIRQLIKHNSKIFLAARTRSKAEETINELKREVPKASIEYLELDLTSLKSVAAAAENFNSRSDRLDILFNNAGIMNVPYGLTQEGYEIQLGTNHIGHALLTKLLLPSLLRTAESSNSDVRIINLSSAAHNFAYFSWGLVLDTARSYYWPTNIRYGTTKLANMLHALSLAQRYPQITATSVHPGTIDTQLFDATSTQWLKIPVVGTLINSIMRSTLSPVASGAKNQLWAATAPKQEVRQGYYFEPVGVKKGGGLFATAEQANMLWDWTEAELKKHGY